MGARAWIRHARPLDAFDQRVSQSTEQLCSALKVDSGIGVGGINDWNTSVDELYGAHAGSEEEFGLRFFANCVQ